MAASCSFHLWHDSTCCWNETPNSVRQVINGLCSCLLLRPQAETNIPEIWSTLFQSQMDAFFAWDWPTNSSMLLVTSCHCLPLHHRHRFASSIIQMTRHLRNTFVYDALVLFCCQFFHVAIIPHIWVRNEEVSSPTNNATVLYWSVQCPVAFGIAV